MGIDPKKSNVSKLDFAPYIMNNKTTEIDRMTCIRRGASLVLELRDGVT